MGDDFAYFNTEETFLFIEALQKVMNAAGKPFEFIYSTPSNYMEAVKYEARIRELEFPIYSDDFFPLLM